MGNNKIYFCSFCGKDGDSVETLVAGPSNFICDECVDLCARIVLEHKQQTVEKAVKKAVKAAVADVKVELEAERRCRTFWQNCLYIFRRGY